MKTEALAGTIGRGNNMEEDRILAESLLDSHKEKEEHSIVREQIVRKLKSIVTNVRYSSIPQILKLKNDQHLQSPIFAKLEKNSLARLKSPLLQLAKPAVSQALSF